MKKSAGPYMQQAGRGNMEKTGRGIPMEFQGPAMHVPGHEEGPMTKKPKNLNLDQNKRVQVRTFDDEGNPYNIEVTEGSPSHNLSKELGSIPSSFRAVRGLNEKNDPWTAGRDPREKRRLMDSIANSEMKNWRRN